MSKQIDKLDFWKKRIEEAKKGREHYSVYITTDTDWDFLNKEHVKIFDKEVLSDDKVLDAGCGYGRWAGNFANYVGVDFSPDFLQIAQERFPDKTFVQADLAKLPFKDKEFDVAFCVSIKEMVIGNMGEEAWEPMQTELKRVAKKLLILEYTDPDKYFVL